MAATTASSVSNSFCGPSWDTATCSLDSHCKTQLDCDATSGHFCQTNVPDCNVNNLLAEVLLGPGSLAGTGDAHKTVLMGSDQHGGSFLPTASNVFGTATIVGTATIATDINDPSDH
mmetsp:Transcript_2774/g.6006  ORF Transcript_2774/g.6006 Transcript_2774/m.6006 type:complete len:117 (+) Transcript_2774:882-1232(+)